MTSDPGCHDEHIDRDGGSSGETFQSFLSPSPLESDLCLQEGDYLFIELILVLFDIVEKVGVCQEVKLVKLVVSTRCTCCL